MDLEDHTYDVITGRSPSRQSSTNGRARQDKSKIYSLRCATVEQWSYLEEIESRPDMVEFNELWRLYDLFEFKVAFNSDKRRAEATLHGTATREQFQYPGDNYVRADYVHRALNVIKETYIP